MLNINFEEVRTNGATSFDVDDIEFLIECSQGNYEITMNTEEYTLVLSQFTDTDCHYSYIDNVDYDSAIYDAMDEYDVDEDEAEDYVDESEYTTNGTLENASEVLDEQSDIDLCNEAISLVRARMLEKGLL